MSRFTVSVDRDICEAFGVCHALTPEIFHLEPNGAVVDEAAVGRAAEAVLDEVVSQCPRGALTKIQLAD